MNNKQFKSFLCLTTAALIIGCASSGKQVSQTAATSFKEGVTTELEIVLALGKPTGVQVLSGSKTLMYQGSQCQTKAATFVPIVGAFAGGMNCQVTSASYEIDSNGILKRMMYHGNTFNSKNGATPAEQDKESPSAVK